MKDHSESALMHIKGFYTFSEVKKYRPILVSVEVNDTWTFRVPNNREVCELYRFSPKEHFAGILPAVSSNEMGMAINMAIFAIENLQRITKNESL